MSIPPPHGPSREPQGPQGRHPAPRRPAPRGRAPYPPPLFTHGGPSGFAPYGPRPPAVVNGVAVAALVFGVLCLVPAAGLALGLVALWQIKRRGERGRGMAIAGAVLSSLGLALWGAALASGVLTDVWEGIEEGARGNDVLALAEGECFDSPGGLEGWTAEADRVPCGWEHDGEVFAVVALPDGRYPGEGSLADTADERCHDLQDAYVMDPWALPGHVEAYHLVPSRESWRFGDRYITCVFGDRDPQQTLTGSLRRDETTLDAHQLAYLEAEGVLGAALDEAPGSSFPEDDLPGHREWAAKVADALAEEVRMLRGHEWPAGAERPVEDLAADLAEAGGEWAKAAGATDADTYIEHADAGWDVTDPYVSVTARHALGLTATPPEYDEEAERDTDGGGMKV